jgi:hypothetical protein
MGITGIFETWTGGVPGLDFRDEASSSRKVRTALFDSQTLPDNPLQLTSFDLIVWPQPQPDELSSDQLNALTSWVANGGNLFLSISETWKSVQDSSLDPLLPVELTGLDDNDEWRLAFKTFPLKAPKETTAPIVRATLRDTAVPLSMITKTQPLWALSPHGMGTVSVFLADINIAPFGRNQHRGDLWRTLLWVPKADASPLTNPFSEQQLKALPLLHAMISANDRDKDPSLKKARKRLADIDGISPWPVRWLLFFAGAYLLLIGPITSHSDCLKNNL